MGVRLPAEYQEVEYLEREANGAYIALPIEKYNLADSDLYLDLAVISPTSGERAYVGSMSTAIDSIGRCPAWEGYFPSLTWQYSGSDLTIEVVESTISTLSVRGQIHYRFSNSAYIALTLFQYRSGGYQCANRYYGVRIEKNGVITAKFVSCYRKSDSEPGMYDLVSGEFYTNQDTGEFLVGPDVVNHISPRLMDRRRVLIAKLTSLFKNIISSQTGLVSFNTNFAKPMKVTCEFSPKQDLHGYDNPWPAGGGKNLFDKDYWGSMSAYPNAGSYGYSYSDYMTLKPNTAYTISAQDSSDLSANRNMYIKIPSAEEPVNPVSDNGSGVYPLNAGVWSNKTFTTGLSGKISIGLHNFTAELLAELIAKNIQLEEGSTATAYAPYENICPIEGWDGANIYGTGNNIWDEETEKGYWAVNTGAKVDNNNYIRCANYIPVQPNTEYRFVAPERAYQRTFLFFGSSKNIISYDSYNNNPAHLITPNDCYYITFYVNSGYGSTYSNDISINYPATDTTYHAYHGATLHIPFNNPGTYDFLPVQEGTGDPSPENIRPITPGLTFTRDDTSTLSVYSGTLIVNEDGSGTLVADVIGKRVTSDLGTINFSVDRVRYTVMDMLPLDAVPTISNQRYLCNIFPKVSGSSASGIVFTQNGDGTSSFILFRGLDSFGITNTLDGWNQFITDNEVFITYVLATPVTYNLTVAETSRAFEALGLGKNLGPLFGGTATINKDGSVDVVSTHACRMIGSLSSIDAPNGDNEPWNHRWMPREWISGSGATWERGGPVTMCSELTPGNAATNGTYLPDYFYIYDNTVSTVSEFREKYANVQVAYPIKPQFYKSYHFSSIADFKSFIGSNNIWSDLNGPITVEYYNNEKE